MAGTADTDRAFADLVDRLLDRVYRYLRNLTRSDDDARDLTQETFLKLRRRLTAESSPSDAYVFATARNTALSDWRRRQRRPDGASTDPWHNENHALPTDPADAPDSHYERGELRSALEDALAHLPEEQRSVFLLAEIEGLRHGEIAEILGLPEGTVASRKHHATLKLRRMLERSGHALR